MIHRAALRTDHRLHQSSSLHYFGLTRAWRGGTKISCSFHGAKMTPCVFFVFKDFRNAWMLSDSGTLGSLVSGALKQTYRKRKKEGNIVMNS
jgi:hypothetical protein